MTGRLPGPEREGRTDVKLYHLDWERSHRLRPEGHMAMIMDSAPAEAYLEAFREGLYVHVADVDADDLGYMFAATNTIEGDPWNVSPAEGVTPVRTHPPMRSTSVGDVVAHEGRLLVVGKFRDIGPAEEPMSGPARR